jgi:opacity protein-like surface antigen
MNTTLGKFAPALALGFSLASSQVLRAELFVRASVQHFGYTESYSSEMGGSVTGGMELGPAREHELSLEMAHVAWSWSMPSGLAPGLGGSGEGHVTPILANYRYYFRAPDARVRAYAGISAGIMKWSGDAKFLGSGISYGGSDSGAVVTFGATMGITGKLTETLSYDLGYRYLQAQEMEMATRTGVGTSMEAFNGPAGPTLHLPSPSAHIVALGLKVRF